MTDFQINGDACKVNRYSEERLLRAAALGCLVCMYIKGRQYHRDDL